MSCEPDPHQREVCLCFHVTLGKLLNFAARRQLRVAAQFSECHGAGTGCGWCIPFLERLHEQIGRGEAPELGMSLEEYRRRRIEYHKTKKPELPPPADAEGPIDLDLDRIVEDVSEEMRLD